MAEEQKEVKEASLQEEWSPMSIDLHIVGPIDRDYAWRRYLYQSQEDH